MEKYPRRKQALLRLLNIFIMRILQLGAVGSMRYGDFFLAWLAKTSVAEIARQKISQSNVRSLS